MSHDLILFLEFDCLTAVEILTSRFQSILILNYNSMKDSLFARHVVTGNEIATIEEKSGKSKMEYLILNIILPSLRGKFSKKYKGFLAAMEENDDIDLKSMAESLGKLISIKDWLFA